MTNIDVERATIFLKSILETNNQLELGPEFWWYFRHSLTNGSTSTLENTAKRYVQGLVDDFNLAGIDPVEKKILDAGCGYGLNSVIIRLIGAQEVHGIDLNKEMIYTFKKYLALIPNFDGVFPEIGNVSQTGYPDCFFDFVFCHEAISHYYDVIGFIREMYRVLKAGGILYISDANNGANPYIVWRVRKIWERFENGPCGDVFYSRVDHPYLEKRKQLIADTFPNLRCDEIIALASGTFQYTRHQILEACELYITSKNLPTSYFKKGRTPVDPESDNYQESLIFPHRLSEQLHQQGFKVKVYSYLGGAGGNPILRIANRIALTTSPLSWPIGRALKLVAIKQHLS